MGMLSGNRKTELQPPGDSALYRRGTLLVSSQRGKARGARVFPMLSDEALSTLPYILSLGGGAHF